MVFDLLTLTAPLLWAATAELLGQRSGVLNIGIEGIMLLCCLTAAVSAPVLGPWWAMAAAMVVGLLCNCLFALVIRFGADQIVAGTGMVLIGFGASGAVFRHVARHGYRGLVPTLPWGGVEIGAFVAVALLAWFLAHTRAGLVVRSCGENPGAVAAAGIDPQRVRLLVLATAGTMLGLAGAALVLRASGTFVEGMTAGRGFLALALVLLGRWRAWLVALATVLVGAATSLQLFLQGLGITMIPYHLLLALPYLATLIVLALLPPDRSRGPAALAKPYRAQR